MKTVTIDLATIYLGEGQDLLVQASSLGANVGIGIYHPILQVGGVYSFILPDSTQSMALDPHKHPLIFADTGLKTFFDMARAKGIGDFSQAKIAVCGGASFLDAFGGQNLGERNCRAAKRFFTQQKVDPGLFRLGGNHNYGLALDFAAGVLRVETFGEDAIEL